MQDHSYIFKGEPNLTTPTGTNQISWTYMCYMSTYQSVKVSFSLAWDVTVLTHLEHKLCIFFLIALLTLLAGIIAA